MISRSQLIPSISCVMPAFNEARCLRAVVAQTLSVLQQLSPRVELIVVDDGSQDDTARVM
jgi:polyisoprenyl-phosphate glycosyltransferase